MAQTSKLAERMAQTAKSTKNAWIPPLTDSTASPVFVFQNALTIGTPTEIMAAYHNAKPVIHKVPMAQLESFLHRISVGQFGALSNKKLLQIGRASCRERV